MFRRRRKRLVDLPDTTPIRRRPGIDVSITGLVYCSLMMFMGLAAINTQANLLFGVFGLMVGIGLISLWISGVVLKRLQLERRLPDHAIVGQPTSVAYAFVNRKRFWPSVSVTVAELEGVEAFVKQPHGYLLHCAAGMTATIPVELVPKRRGMHTLGRHQISTSFPFGFIKRAVERDKTDQLLAYPAIGHVDARLLQMCRSAESIGPTVRPRRGGTDEFFGLKDYRQGESPRFIYWRRSARTGTLVTREMTHVSPPRLMILLDTFVAARTPAHHADVEMCIAMAASLASYALESDLPVGLAVWSNGFRTIEPQRGKRHRRDILTLLAQLPLNATFDAGKLMSAAYDVLDGVATPVLLTPSAHGDARSAMLAIRPHTPQADKWFKFDPKIDFAHAMPPEQQLQRAVGFEVREAE
jgi:uncharacterized protein (DUF58 family)